MPGPNEPTPIKRRVKNALQETRFLLLGAQVLLVFQGRAALLPGYEDLTLTAKWATLLGLFPSLLVLVLLLAPLPFHHIVEKGRVSERFHRFITDMARYALLVFALCLGCMLFIAGDRLLSSGAALAVGALATALGLGCWFGIERWARRKQNKPDESMDDKNDDGELPELSDRIDQVLSEGSMVIPGNTALLGFGLLTMLQESFSKLPPPVQYMQFGGVLMIALSVVLLMTPAAYHRLVEEGHDTEDFYKLATRLITAALVPFGFGINSGLFVVAYKVTNSYPVALASLFGMLTVAFGFWFGYTVMKRAKVKRTTPEKADAQTA